MNKIEIIVTFFGSGLFTSLIAMFYRLGKNQSKIEMCFKRIDEKFEGVDKRFDKLEIDIKDIKKEISQIDKEVAVITATLRFNGFDLDRHKAEGE